MIETQICNVLVLCTNQSALHQCRSTLLTSRCQGSQLSGVATPAMKQVLLPDLKLYMMATAA